MNITSILLILLYSMVIASLIWARFRFFNISTKSSRIGSLFYDPAVTIQIVMTYYLFFSGEQIPASLAIIGAIFYIAGLTLFFWSIVTAKQLDFAFSDNVGKIVTSGPFALIRHPLYLSYIFVWFSSTLLFNSITLWITLIYLVAFYIRSAKSEEKAILASDYSKEYLDYSQNVGMFIPRINSWKN